MIASTEPCSFDCFLYRWGQEPMLDLLAQMRPRFLATLGARQRVGSELQRAGANMAWRRQCGSTRLCAGPNMGCTAHVLRVCTCFLVRSMDDASYSKYSFNHDVQDVAARLQPVSSLQTDWCHVLHQSWPTSSTLSVVELQTRRELTPVPLVASESHMVSSATRPSEGGRSLGNAMPVHGGQKGAGNSCGGQARRHTHGEERTRERGGWSWT